MGLLHTQELANSIQKASQKVYYYYTFKTHSIVYSRHFFKLKVVRCFFRLFFEKLKQDRGWNLKCKKIVAGDLSKKNNEGIHKKKIK